MKAAPHLAHLARPGRVIAVRVTPRAARNAVLPCEGNDEDAPLRIQVTAAPEGGKANRAAQRILAQALGVAKTRLTLVHGATRRDKRFRLD